MTAHHRDEVIRRLTELRQHQDAGIRSPHKPLLVLLALGRLTETGSSALPWSTAEHTLADLLLAFGPPSGTSRPQSAAYPFTRLRSDFVWQLSHDVPMDLVTPLREHHVTGRLDAALERALLADPTLVQEVARRLVEDQFPPSLFDDVLTAVGLDPDEILARQGRLVISGRQRSSLWPKLILQAWDRRCGFCGFDGQLSGTTVGLEAAHVRWFNFDGPDELDNGLALCSLHHKVFDRGVVGITLDHRLLVSQHYSAGSQVGRAVYDLHGRRLETRPGTPLPRLEHLRWHAEQVFKGQPLVA